MVRRILAISLISISAVATAEPPPPCTGEVRNFLVEVTSTSGEAEMFDGVIAHQGELEVINATTPYSFEFSASRIIAMFSSNTNVRITASLYIKNEGGNELVGYSTDPAPAIYESVSCEGPLLRAFGRI